MKKSVALAGLCRLRRWRCRAGASFADYTLNILHINDFHSRIESINKFDSTCSAEEEGKGECFGGAARLMTAIDQEPQGARRPERAAAQRRRQFPGLAVLHDLQGRGRSRIPQPHEVRRHDRRQPRIRRRRRRAGALPRQGAVPGRHRQCRSRMPQSKIGDRIKPSVVLDVGGQKIGIVGAVTNDTPELASPGPNITIADDVADDHRRSREAEGARASTRSSR